MATNALWKCRICAVTIYRIHATSATGDPRDPRTQKTFATIALTASLESLLGTINACLPIMRPVIKKLRNVLPQLRQGTPKSATSGTIPIMMRMSQLFSILSTKQRRSSKSTRSAELLWSEEQSESKQERSLVPRVDGTLETSISRITVHKNVDVETASCEA